MLKHLVITLVLASSVGCAEHGPIDMSYHGSDEGYAASLLAAAAWNNICKADLIHVSRIHDNADVEIYGLYMRRPTPTDLGLTYFTWFENAWKIEFYDDPAEPLLVPIMTHEFGHTLLGPKHETTGIMRANINPDELTSDGFLTPGMISQDECNRAINR